MKSYVDASKVIKHLTAVGIKSDIVSEVVNCCLRPEDFGDVREGSKCEYCVAEKILLDMRRHLFYHDGTR